METDLSSSLVAARTVGTRQSLDLAMLKRAQEAEQSFVAMMQEVARTAPVPEGQGTKVDKSA